MYQCSLIREFYTVIILHVCELFHCSKSCGGETIALDSTAQDHVSMIHSWYHYLYRITHT